MPPSMLMSATYNNVTKRAVLKFYDPAADGIHLWEDQTGHKPYCYSKLSPENLDFLNDRSDVATIESVERYDLIADEPVRLTKITTDDPLAIGGGNDSIRNITETWESNIKYYSNYLYDRGLIIGRYYEITGGKVRHVQKEIPQNVKLALQSMLWDKISNESMADPREFQKYTSDWADLLNQPIPQIKRIAFDIEIEFEKGRIPDPKAAEKTVTAVSFVATDNVRTVYVLKRGNNVGKNDLPEGSNLVFYDQERKMIEDAFRLIASYPVVLTFNGDEFDMPYLYHRARRLAIPDSENPLYMMRDAASLKHGVHIDLYRTVSNRSFQIYAFGNKYQDYSLNSVSQALLGEGKIDYEKEFDEMTLYELGKYCLQDSILTYNLTSFGDDTLMNLLVVIARIARLPIDDVSRMGVSQWIRSLLYYEHRQRNALIPNSEELVNKTADVQNTAIIKNKKYRGGMVVEPVEGIHFNVTVMDFASLYPSIIKVRNISYETVRCPHEECTDNRIPDTNHWACKKKNGMTALVIGSLRDLRVNYYKSLSRDRNISDEMRQQYTAVSQALKVILNASYGVMGADTFPLYFLPAAEATTATGRYIILNTKEQCKKSGINVLYGDTDSLFIKNPTDEQIEMIINYAKKEYEVELEIDKVYRYVLLSERKKNYLGVSSDGKVDIKGLTGKKSHTPRFIKKLFYELLDMLSRVQNEEEFEASKTEVGDKIMDWATRLNKRRIPLEDLAFHVMLSKPISEYTKSMPQHVKAARQLGTEPKKGDIISYVKVVGKIGIKPVELAKIDEIDSAKYLDFMQSMLDQITSQMGLDFDTMIGKPKQTGLDEFFWS